jgi:hypothetical protein
MAKWHDLPLEIRDSILSCFCADIVAEFAELGFGPWENEAYEWIPDESSEWPKSPECLYSFSSALRTCRYFHNTITNHIKINGETSGVILQREQHMRVRAILDLQRDDPASVLVRVGLLYVVAGCFWRNPIVYEDFNFLDDVLVWITPISRMMLIPHLEPWLLCHARPTESPASLIIRVGVGGDIDNCLWMQLREGSLRVEGSILSIVSIAGVATLDDPIDEDDEFPPCDQNLPALLDIKNSPPDTWWFFPPEDLGVAVDEMQWSLVNYRRQKIYSGPDGSWGRYWKDIWNVTNWRTFKHSDEGLLPKKYEVDV